MLALTHLLLARTQLYTKGMPGVTIAAMHAKVYGIPGSHPVRTGLLMLERKGIPYDLIDMPSVLCRPYLRAVGFPGPTVPAVKLDGRKVQTTRGLSRVLDEVEPDPPLFPRDQEARRQVEDTERWGDEVLQPVPRRLSYAALTRDRSPLASFLERPLFDVPPKAVAVTAGPIMALGKRVNKASDATARADLEALPGMLDHVDALIAEGVIGGAEPNAADFQIATSVRLMLNFDDLAPAIIGRPAAEHAQRLVAHYPGNVPPVLPLEWLEPLRRP